MNSNDPCEEYVRQVSRHLRKLPPSYRREIIAGLRYHISEKLTAGDDCESIISSLGSPGEVVTAAFESFSDENTEAQFSNRSRVYRNAQVGSFFLSLAGWLTVTLSPLWVRQSERMGEAPSLQSSTMLSDSPKTAALMALPPLIALIATVLKSRRSSLVSALVLTVYVLLGALSVGVYFVPALLAAITATAAFPSKERVGQS